MRYSPCGLFGVPSFAVVPIGSWEVCTWVAWVGSPTRVGLLPCHAFNSKKVTYVYPMYKCIVNLMLFPLFFYLEPSNFGTGLYNFPEEANVLVNHVGIDYLYHWPITPRPVLWYFLYHMYRIVYVFVRLYILSLCLFSIYVNKVYCYF